MKKVIKGQELQVKMQEAINLLCDTVKTTFGPIGNNVLIDSTLCSPFITNDGVTIAESIESEDPILNTILTIAKEASIKTNEMVGDGTTTTLILLQSIFIEGVYQIQLGKNPFLLKKEIDESTKEILDKLSTLSWKPRKSDYEKIAKISSNDLEIGSTVSDLYLKMKHNGSIQIREGFFDKTIIEEIKGYRIDAGTVSEYFLNNKKNRKVENTKILLIKGTINYLEEIAEVINCILETGKPLCILADSYSEEVKNQIIVENYQKHLDVILIETPDYASRKTAILGDVAILSNAKIIDFGLNETPNYQYLGDCSEIQINKDETIIVNHLQYQCELNDRVEELENCLDKESDEYEKEYIKERIAKLKYGMAFIYVGGPTKTEKREKKMRYEDALCALEKLSHGVLLGSGTALLQVSDSISDNTIGSIIMKHTLEKPIMQILENFGIDESAVIEKLKIKNYNEVYNPILGSFEIKESTDILDPLEVIRNAVQNASSIATMLLTTSHLVINEKENRKISTDLEL